MTDWKAKFQAYSTESLIGQIRMDARHAFTPEDEAYLLEIATRLEQLFHGWEAKHKSEVAAKAEAWKWFDECQRIRAANI